MMNLTKIIHAYDFAKTAHREQKRKTGEPCITHPVAVSQILHEQGADETTICAALLHDVVEDTPISLKTIEEKFGKDIAFLVDGVTKDENKEKTFEKVNKYSSKDKRVALLKLADRIHNTSALENGNTGLEKMQAKYTLTNFWYIQLGREHGYESLAEQLAMLTKKHCLPK